MTGQTLDTQVEKERRVLKVRSSIIDVEKGEVVVIDYPRSLVSEPFIELVTGFSPGSINTLGMIGWQIHLYERPISDGCLARPMPHRLRPKEVYEKSTDDLAKQAIYNSLYELLKSKGMVR